MEPESRSRQLASYSFLVVFANDQTISEAELDMLKKLALEDRQVDEAEREVLQAIFSRVSEETVSPEVWKEITEFRAQYEI